jgi:hypothetical protein
MHIKTAESYTVRIWIAGDYDDARRAIKEFCAVGACFAVQEAEYIYTGGAESGVCVTRINYPRFPISRHAILNQCKQLADLLMERLHQDSYSIDAPDVTIWKTKRGGVLIESEDCT